MKKLMIAAAAAAMIAGVQADELCEESVGGAGCSVYNVKFTFKTLSGKTKTCAATYLIEGETTQLMGLPAGSIPPGRNGVWTRYANGAMPGNAAVWPLAPGLYAQPQQSWPNNGAKVTAAYYNLWAGAGEPTTLNSPRKPGKGVIAAGSGAAAWYGELYWADNATRTLEGLLWQCAASCFEGNAVYNNKGSGEIYFALWEKKTQKVFSYPVFKYYKNSDMSTFNWITADETRAFNWMGRYGAKAEKIGVDWTPTLKSVNRQTANRYGWDWIRAVGFGTYDVKALHMKSVTGGAVAQLEPYVGEAVCEEEFKVQIAYVCEPFKGWCCDPCYAAVDWVPAYGNWSLKYNASLSKGKTPLSKVLPSYAVFSESGDNNWTRGYDSKGIYHWLDAAFPAAGQMAGNPAGFYADNATAVIAAGAWVQPAAGVVHPVVIAGQGNANGLGL